ncbi:MAG: hypothetical protein GY946_01945 [bacterium]|nr:hypothetical protein [bacterium]
MDTQIDPGHCGGCDMVCDAGDACEAGACVSGSCEADESPCGGGCKDLGFDPKHCGDCDNKCALGQVCGTGVCACSPLLDLCDGQCVDQQSDPMHCGGCGNDCRAAGQVCTGGQCEDLCVPQFPESCGGACTDTQTDVFNCGECGVACEVGKVCAAGECEEFEPSPCGMCPCTDCKETCCDSGFVGYAVCVKGNGCPR